MKMTLMAASAVALGALALASLQSEAEATGRGGGGQSLQSMCFWYKQKAMSTGDESWWERWRRCIRYNEF